MRRRIVHLLAGAVTLLPTITDAETPGRIAQPVVDSDPDATPSCPARDWCQWGGTPCRNNSPRASGIPVTWDLDSGRNLLWSVPLGSQTNATPVVAGGRVYVGTNNGSGYLARFPADVDLGCLLCFKELTGEFLWQFSAEKLPTGRLHDWPQMGICSSPYAKGDRLWLVSNRCELVCLDADGFRDGENDGPFRREIVDGADEADIVWSLDMMGELGVQPHNMANCSVTGAKGVLFVTTSNGVDKSHENVPAPQAPSFLAVDEFTGQVLWSDNSPGANILHGQWSSPAFAVLGGLPQVIFAGGDGWLYSFCARGDGQGGSRLLWKFDCNLKHSRWQSDGAGTRNNIIATPVIHGGLVYVATGLDPEKPVGQADLWCIDPTRYVDGQDVSLELVRDGGGTPVPHHHVQAVTAENGEWTIPNPHSALVWHYNGADCDGDGKADFHECFHRTLCSVAIRKNLLIVPDLAGVVHCLDATTGEVYWTCDLLDSVWASPMIADGKIFVATERGEVAVFRLDQDPDIAMHQGEPIASNDMGAPIHATPVVADNVLYIATSRRLFAIQSGPQELVTKE